MLELIRASELKRFNKIFQLVMFIVALIIYLVMDNLEGYVVKYALLKRDLFFFLNIYISWSSIKFFFLGLSVGIGILWLLPLIILLLACEFRFEMTLKREIVLVNVKPRFTVSRMFFYGYLLFAPIVIITKLLISLKSGDMFKYYLLVGELTKQYIWLLLIVLVIPYLLVDMSRARAWDSKRLLMKYPSALLNIFAVIILGGGSILSLAPMYYDILSVFRDPILTAELFVYAIAFFYIPSLVGAIGFYVGCVFVGKEDFGRAISTFESKINAEKIELIKRDKEKQRSDV